jgi:hypothetical protein
MESCWSVKKVSADIYMLDEYEANTFLIICALAYRNFEGRQHIYNRLRASLQKF